MPLVVKKYEDSAEAPVQWNMSLLDFAAMHVDPVFGTALKRAEAVAQLNFGTKSPREVARALAETVGLALDIAPDLDAFRDFRVLAAQALQPEGAPRLRIPEAWSAEDLPAETSKRVKVRRARPANTVSIESLDKWFVPEAESCDIGWRIGGLEATAGRLQVDVYASKYCRFNGFGPAHATYAESAALSAMPVFSDDAVPHAERGGAQYGWTGETTATDGCLRRSADPQRKRYVNVAFSPYTAHMRYFRNDADSDARLELKPFWPRWDAADARIAESFRVKWRLHDTGGTLRQGLLTIVDGQDRPVFRKRLTPAELTDGDHEFDWGAGDYAPGVVHDGRRAADPSQMPYRVKIEAHRPAHAAEGLALAAMHSEVRIWVHPATLRRDAADYLWSNDVSSLLFSVAPLNHTDAPWDKNADQNLWLREKLAACGYFPGAVRDAGYDVEFRTALRNLKQSVPKPRAGAAADFERIDDTATPEANIAEVKRALEAMEADTDGYSRYVRKWFGKADATRDDYDDNWGDALRDTLRDPAAEAIVWIDDRHFYTSFADWNIPGAPGQPSLNDYLRDHEGNQRPSRGGWTVGDARIDHDARDMTRCAIPIQVQPVLMRKGRSLHDPSDYLAGLRGDAALLAQMRNAMGPIRIDWSFDEIDGDYDPALPGVQVQVGALDPAMYGDNSRSQAALEWTLDDQKAAHARRDVNRTALYHNAPEDLGGIRPAAAAAYYRAPFGRSADGTALTPWSTADDAASETLATSVHDDLGQGHADDEKFAVRRGFSGINFRPSLIAGDGYRLRARVRFDDTAGWALPNREALKNRYPLTAQAHTAKLRMWRKSSVRAYVQWSPHNNFAAAYDSFRQHYAQANVHYVTEGGGAQPLQLRPSDLFQAGAADPDYRDAARTCVDAASPLANPATMSFHDDNIWPWHRYAHFGQQDPVQDAPHFMRSARAIFEDNELAYPYYRYSILIGTKIVEKLERMHGLLRGNVIVEIQTSPPYYTQDYKCEDCGARELWLETSAVPSRSGQPCSNCAPFHKRMLARPYFEGRYTCTANNHAHRRIEANGAGGAWQDDPCPSPACGGTLDADSIDHALYECSSCNFINLMPHEGGDRAGDPCPTGCGGALRPAGKVYAGQDYACNACATRFSAYNATRTRDEHVGATHTCPGGGSGTLIVPNPPNYVYDFTVPGALINKLHVDLKHQAIRVENELPGSSLGLPMGVSFNFNCDVWSDYACNSCGAIVSLTEPNGTPGHHQNKEHKCTAPPYGRYGPPLRTYNASSDLWAHEVGHNHSLSHANNAGSAEPAEHDAVDIPGWTGAISAPEDKHWDRSCLMAYSDMHADFSITADQQYMCYRCLLRSRGWKVHALNSPGGGVRN